MEGAADVRRTRSFPAPLLALPRAPRAPSCSLPRSRPCRSPSSPCSRARGGAHARTPTRARTHAHAHARTPGGTRTPARAGRINRATRAHFLVHPGGVRSRASWPPVVYARSHRGPVCACARPRSRGAILSYRERSAVGASWSVCVRARGRGREASAFPSRQSSEIVKLSRTICARVGATCASCWRAWR